MPAKPLERQYRTMSVPLSPIERAEAGTGKRFDTEYYVEGYASTFNDPYVLYEDWDGIKQYEVISPDAFQDTDMSDVIMQYNHEGHVFARIKNNTLIVEPNAYGLFVAGDLGKSEGSRSLYEEIAAGLSTQMSWCFLIGAQEYDRDTHTNTITRVKKIFDVSVVSTPADPNTEISARNLLGGETERIRKELADKKRRVLSVARASLALHYDEKWR